MTKEKTYEVRGTVFRDFSLNVQATSAEEARRIVSSMRLDVMLSKEDLQLPPEIDQTSLEAEEKR